MQVNVKIDTKAEAPLTEWVDAHFVRESEHGAAIKQRALEIIVSMIVTGSRDADVIGGTAAVEAGNNIGSKEQGRLLAACTQVATAVLAGIVRIGAWNGQTMAEVFKAALNHLCSRLAGTDFSAESIPVGACTMIARQLAEVVVIFGVERADEVVRLTCHRVSQHNAAVADLSIDNWLAVMQAIEEAVYIACAVGDVSG